MTARHLALGCVLVLLAACGQQDGFRAPAAGDPVPAFQAATLEGETVSLEELRGHAVLLNIWATWCAPCREEMPGLQALHERFADQGLRVVAVSIDGRRNDRDVREFLDEYGISFTILRDPDEQVTRTFRAVGVPESYLIDREGRITRRWIGLFDPMAPDVQADVISALGGERSAG